MPQPKQGETYRFTGETIGIDAGAVKTGTVVEIREIVPANEVGAHNDREDAVVVEISEPTVVYDEEGNPGLGIAKRAVSFALDYFEDNFEKGK